MGRKSKQELVAFLWGKPVPDGTPALDSLSYKELEELYHGYMKAHDEAISKDASQESEQKEKSLDESEAEVDKGLTFVGAMINKLNRANKSAPPQMYYRVPIAKIPDFETFKEICKLSGEVILVPIKDVEREPHLIGLIQRISTVNPLYEDEAPKT